jgi:UDP:flavonoid glycosyltransferase YjiC (YdhE family)
MIKCPKNLKVFEFLLYRVHNFFIKKYSECWVPDIENSNNLSGDLSHKYPLSKNTFYIGPLSRFNSTNSDSRNIKLYDILFLISGPEPQRTVLEKIAQNCVSSSKLKIAIVRGVAETNAKSINSEHLIVNYASAIELNDLINKSELIISRSGYSTIMDLAVLGKNAILIPTPGQTEQEYLADYLLNKSSFFYMKQDEFSLNKAVEGAKKYSGIRIRNNYNILSERVCLL